MKTGRVLLAAALVCLAPLALSACGLRGDLERPVPMWGNPPNEGPNDPRTIKAAKEEAERKKAEEDARKRAAEQPTETPDGPK